MWATRAPSTRLPGPEGPEPVQPPTQTRWRRVTACDLPPMPEDHFGEDVAARYDESSASMFDPSVLGPTVDLLAEPPGTAPLEFAVGTGRVALPLAARGVPMAGIEFSTAMAERLRAKDEAGRAST